MFLGCKVWFELIWSVGLSRSCRLLLISLSLAKLRCTSCLRSHTSGSCLLPYLCSFAVVLGTLTPLLLHSSCLCWVSRCFFFSDNHSSPFPQLCWWAIVSPLRRAHVFSSVSFCFQSFELIPSPFANGEHLFTEQYKFWVTKIWSDIICDFSKKKADAHQFFWRLMAALVPESQ